MSKAAKHITTYITIFSLLFSSLGITIYYHHCNKEQITLKSVIGKIQCDHDQQFDDREDSLESCCHQSDNNQNECSNQKNYTTHELIFASTSCCVDSQVTKKLNHEFFGSDKQKLNKNQFTNTHNDKSNQHESKINFVKQTKEYLNKKIIHPIKKFISLLVKLSKITSKSDNEDSTF